MKIKHLQTLKEPRLRHYDGETLTHAINITLTTEEAVTISDMFSRAEKTADGSTPRTSLIRGAIMIMAEQRMDEEFVIESMKKHQIRTELARKLSTPEVEKALHLLSESKKPKQPQPKAKPPEKPQRQVFIPDPPRRKYIR